MKVIHNPFFYFPMTTKTEIRNESVNGGVPPMKSSNPLGSTISGQGAKIPCPTCGDRVWTCVDMVAQPETARNEKRETARNKRWKPPRGIRLVTLKTRPNQPFAVQWRVKDSVKTKTFPREEEQIDFAKDLAGGAEEFGRAAFVLNPDEAREWRGFRAQIGNNVALDAVLACWLRHGVERSALSVREAVAQFLAAKRAEGLSESSLGHYEPVYNRMTAALGNKHVAVVTREDLTGWVDGLKMADWSRRTHIKRAQSFFAWLKVNRLIDENPCDGLAANKIVPREVEVLTIDEARSLFANNESESPELLGRIALEAFAGLRFSSAAQVVGADIAFDVHGITLPAAKIKTRRRQFIDGLPENLWVWLKRSEPKNWKLTHRQYLLEKSLAFVRAKIRHPHNCLRHSFASYHVAANKDAAKTAIILCHSSPKMLWSHYKGRATEADGATYFKILPS